MAALSTQNVGTGGAITTAAAAGGGDTITDSVNDEALREAWRYDTPRPLDVVEHEQLDRAALPCVEVVVLGGGRQRRPRGGEIVVRPPDRETDERVGPLVLERVRLDRALPARRDAEPVHRVDQILLVLRLGTVDREVVEHRFPFLCGDDVAAHAG
jgi:hypothetical protein